MAEPDSRCAISSDANETPYRFTKLSSKFAAQCVDSNRFRAIANLKISGTSVMLSNYHHNNEFWTASFSTAVANIDAVYFQVVRFPILGVVEAAHTQIRFKFKNPVELKSQSSSKVTTTNELLISFEAVRPKDQSYNFALGALENYAIVGRATSSSQRYSESQTSMEQYELDLSDSEKKALLVSTIKHAEDIGIKYTYNTLRPNCTTELFDLIDALPSLKDKFPQFMTVISNDPVAQPSIDALQSRQILMRRVQNFEEEARGLIGAREIPARKSIPALPDVPGRPWSLVVTLPNLSRLSPNEQAAILKIRSELLKKAPLTLQALGSAMMKEAGADTSTLITKSLEIVQEDLSKLLRSVNETLPNSPQLMGLYLVPYNAPQTVTTLRGLNVPAALPFSIVDTIVDDSVPRSQEIFYHLAEGVRAAGDIGWTNKLPAYFSGSAIRVRLQRDHSSVRSQLLVGLNDFVKPFTMSNSQVNFQTAMLSGAAARSVRPILLLTHSQDANLKANPIVKIEFGSEGGIAGSSSDLFTSFQIRKAMNGSCEVQTESSPTLKGTLAASALGKPILDRLVQGKNVAFHIVGADFNVKSLEVSSMDVRVSTWPLNCLSTDDVNSQFRQNANDMLNKFKAESLNSGLIEKLLNGLAN